MAVLIRMWRKVSGVLGNQISARERSRSRARINEVIKQDKQNM